MSNEPLRPFKAVVWVGELAGERVAVDARDLEDASEILKKRYGDKAIVTLWNEEDANAPR